jgi:homogentisate 1,2-dioxygenase
MPSTATLDKISINEQVGRLTEPFTMIDLANIDDLALSIFMCQGTMPHHRHLDQDELFLVYSGTISLESEWGTAILRPGELAVAPKGLGHRSSSLLHSLVLLIQPRLLANRRNGNRRLYSSKGEGRLEKVSLPAIGRQIVPPFVPIEVADVDTFSLTLTLCNGIGPWVRKDKQASLVLCQDGRISLETEQEQVRLDHGDLVVVPKGTAYRLSSEARALALGLQRHDQPGLPLP